MHVPSQPAPLLLSVVPQQNAMEYWREGSTPLPYCQHHKVGGITFEAAFIDAQNQDR